MLWQPLNLAQTCPDNTNLTACTSFGYFYLDLLVRLFGKPLKKRKERKYSKNEFDFVVVGAGSAGCVVANRLSAVNNFTVLLLEAGGEQPQVTLVPGLTKSLQGSNIDWAYKTEPNGKSCLARPGQRCGLPRGKTMGGCSSIQAMLYMRGNKLDYDGWAADGNTGWSYEEVLPYFKKSENNLNIEGLNRKYHGVNGPQAVSRFPCIDKSSIAITEAFNEKGIRFGDFNAETQFTTTISQAFSQNGERRSSNQAYIEPIRDKRPNLIVRTNSEAYKILIDENKRAYGVRYIKNNKKYTVYAKKEVIVSAGTVNSPKLLMLSGIGPKEHLAEVGIKVVKDLRVGDNLHDHVTFNGLILALPNATKISNDRVVKELFAYKQAKCRRGLLASNGLLTSVAYIGTEPGLPAPDIQFQVDGVVWKEYLKEPLAYEKLKFVYPSTSYTGLTTRVINLIPKSRGKVRLNPKNPSGPPLLYPNYFADPSDLTLLVKGTKFFLTLDKTEAFKSIGAYFVREPLEACKNHEWGTDDYIVCLIKSYTLSAYHTAGSCKMGPMSDEDAVVDPELKVYGISGLRVIDCSIIPSIPRGNTNAACLMIAEKGVDFILKRYLK